MKKQIKYDDSIIELEVVFNSIKDEHTVKVKTLQYPTENFNKSVVVSLKQVVSSANKLEQEAIDYIIKNKPLLEVQTSLREIGFS